MLRLTGPEGEEARSLAIKLKQLIDDNFLDPPKNSVHEEIMMIRRRLAEMGFYVEIEYLIPDKDKIRLDSVVTLYLPKQIH